jgi:alpha-D-ribose 1-methylphosphonate 5-triphosphate diphosphatase
MTTTCLYGGTVFDGRRIINPGGIVFKPQGIVEVYHGDAARSADHVIHVNGMTIMPGLVDLHSDALEKHIEMRPGVCFDPAFALQSLDNRLAACGVTCFCHAITFGDERSGVRSLEEALRMVRLIRAFDGRAVAPVRHLIHARYEITGIGNLKILLHLLNEGMLDMVSVMDHTPGQGQFKSFQAYKDYYGKTYALSDTELREMIDRKNENRSVGWEKVRDFLAQVQDRQLPLLSHDDDTEKKVVLVHDLGIRASEFPVSLEAASAASKRGMKVFMGAPNLMRGKSTNGNLSAAEAITRDVCHGLVSDYYPESLIQAAFKDHHSLARSKAKALALVSSGPGAYLDPQGRIGFLTPGARADLVVVAETRPWVKPVQTWVAGRCVYTCDHPDLQVHRKRSLYVSRPLPENMGVSDRREAARFF